MLVELLLQIEMKGGKDMARTIFEHFIKMFQVVHNDITVFLENRQRDEKVETTTQPVRP